MKKNTLIKIIAVLALVGVGLSLYSYLHNQGLASGEFCSIDETFNCDVVNKGPYGSFLGIPVSLLGVLGYGFLLLASLMKLRSPEDRSLTLFLVIASTGALGFSLYLTGLEAFVLHAWCLICVTSQITILILSGFVGLLYLNERK